MDQNNVIQQYTFIFIRLYYYMNNIKNTLSNYGHRYQKINYQIFREILNKIEPEIFLINYENNHQHIYDSLSESVQSEALPFEMVKQFVYDDLERRKTHFIQFDIKIYEEVVGHLMRKSELISKSKFTNLLSDRLINLNRKYYELLRKKLKESTSGKSIYNFLAKSQKYIEHNEFDLSEYSMDQVHVYEISKQKKIGNFEDLLQYLETLKVEDQQELEQKIKEIKDWFRDFVDKSQFQRQEQIQKLELESSVYQNYAKEFQETIEVLQEEQKQIEEQNLLLSRTIVEIDGEKQRLRDIITKLERQARDLKKQYHKQQALIVNLEQRIKEIVDEHEQELKQYAQIENNLRSQIYYLQQLNRELKMGNQLNQVMTKGLKTGQSIVKSSFEKQASELYPAKKSKLNSIYSNVSLSSNQHNLRELVNESINSYHHNNIAAMVMNQSINGFSEIQDLPREKDFSDVNVLLDQSVRQTKKLSTFKPSEKNQNNFGIFCLYQPVMQLLWNYNAQLRILYLTPFQFIVSTSTGASELMEYTSLQRIYLAKNKNWIIFNFRNKQDIFIETFRRLQIVKYLIVNAKLDLQNKIIYQTNPQVFVKNPRPVLLSLYSNYPSNPLRQVCNYSDFSSKMSLLKHGFFADSYEQYYGMLDHQILVLFTNPQMTKLQRVIALTADLQVKVKLGHILQLDYNQTSKEVITIKFTCWQLQQIWLNKLRIAVERIKIIKNKQRDEEKGQITSLMTLGKS